MTSAVDSTFPADNVKVSKATFRAQLLIIKNEISALQKRTGVPGLNIFGDHATMDQVSRAIAEHYATQHGFARDIAYARLSL